MLADFELKTLLFQPLTRWNYRCTLPCLTQTRLFSNEKDTMMSVSENCRLNSGHWCTASAFGSSHAVYWLYCLSPCDSLKCVLHLALTSACAKSFTLSKLFLKKYPVLPRKHIPKQPKLALNLWPSSFSLLSAGVISMPHHTYLISRLTFFFCVCIHALVCMWTCVHMSGGQSQHHVSFSITFHLFLWDSSSHWSVPICLDWPASKFKDPPASATPALWVHRHASPRLAFMRVLEIWTQVFLLVSWVLCWYNCLPSHANWNLKISD